MNQKSSLIRSPLSRVARALRIRMLIDLLIDLAEPSAIAKFTLSLCGLPNPNSMYWGVGGKEPIPDSVTTSSQLPTGPCVKGPAQSIGARPSVGSGTRAQQLIPSPQKPNCDSPNRIVVVVPSLMNRSETELLKYIVPLLAVVPVQPR